MAAEVQTCLFLDPLGHLSLDCVVLLFFCDVATALSSKMPAVSDDSSGLTGAFFQAPGAPYTDLSAFLIAPSNEWLHSFVFWRGFPSAFGAICLLQSWSLSRKALLEEDLQGLLLLLAL